MNILLNLIPVRSGGGMQVATNFVRTVVDHDNFGHQWRFLVALGSEVEQLVTTIAPDHFKSVSGSFGKRFYREFFEVPRWIEEWNIDLVFSFGPGLLRTPVCSVTRSTYGNLYFPEIDFWSNWSLPRRTFYRFKDKFRLASTLRADALVFENQAMRQRSISLFGYTEDNTLFIKPSVSDFSIYENTPVPERYQSIKDFSVLLLTGWHKNKNIDLVPDILAALRDSDAEIFHKTTFVITVDATHPYSRQLMDRAERLGVADRINLFGRVPVNEIPHIYGMVDAVMLLSRLECFSSNIVESWHFRRPLLISDEEWSRSICGDRSVVFVPLDNVAEIAARLGVIISDRAARAGLVENGTRELATYNAPYDKVAKQVTFLERIFETCSE